MEIICAQFTARAFLKIHTTDIVWMGSGDGSVENSDGVPRREGRYGRGN